MPGDPIPSREELEATLGSLSDLPGEPPGLRAQMEGKLDAIEKIIAKREKSQPVEAAAEILRTHTGLDVRGQHGKETPVRFLDMLQELTSCRDCDASCMKWRAFEARSQDLVTVQKIPFTSLCNHHVVPFTGWVHVGYVPNNAIAGLSKFARVVRHFAKRLQVQESLTFQIAQFLEEALEPQGVAVVIRAEHMCMTLRGAQVPGTYTTTARMTGVFADHSKSAKQEFLSYINGSH